MEVAFSRSTRSQQPYAKAPAVGREPQREYERDSSNQEEGHEPGEGEHEHMRDSSRPKEQTEQEANVIAQQYRETRCDYLLFGNAVMFLQFVYAVGLSFYLALEIFYRNKRFYRGDQ
ncbi:MAG: hypothetical protein NVS4B9_18470 [Ktedonobacteraceae bacterium]